MTLPPLTVQALAATGCHLNVDASDYPPLTLQALTAAAKNAGGYLIIRNAGSLAPLVAQGIAAAGRQHVQLIV